MSNAAVGSQEASRGLIMGSAEKSAGVVRKRAREDGVEGFHERGEKMVQVDPVIEKNGFDKNDVHNPIPPVWLGTYAQSVQTALQNLLTSPSNSPPPKTPSPTHPTLLFKPLHRVPNSNRVQQTGKITLLSLHCRSCTTPLGKAFVHNWVKSGGDMLMWAEIDCKDCEEGIAKNVGTAELGDVGTEAETLWEDLSRTLNTNESSIATSFTSNLRSTRKKKDPLSVHQHLVCFGGGKKEGRVGGDVECILCKGDCGFGFVNVAEFLSTDGANDLKVSGGGSRGSRGVRSSKRGAGEVEVERDRGLLTGANQVEGETGGSSSKVWWYGKWRDIGLEMMAAS
ncbi:hypothetical protein HDV05_007749 [Chytridiales sp. JEL 0842]|nr:hypothetical protein HDV05_007749 [Chytridiales sp. JEL 0842]